MPNYDYSCVKCQIKWEESHSMNDNSPKPCPVCGELGTKLFSAPALIISKVAHVSRKLRDPWNDHIGYHKFCMRYLDSKKPLTKRQIRYGEARTKILEKDMALQGKTRELTGERELEIMKSAKNKNLSVPEFVGFRENKIREVEKQEKTEIKR